MSWYAKWVGLAQVSGLGVDLVGSWGTSGLLGLEVGVVILQFVLIECKGGPVKISGLGFRVEGLRWR